MGKVTDWTDSLRHTGDEIADLWLDRLIWRGLRELTEGIPVARNSFIVGWIGEQYYRRAALAVRTMVDRDPRSDSLINLLQDIHDNPTQLTCPPSCQAMCAPGADTVDPKLVQDDINSLTTTAAAVQSYVNKYLAHIDRAPTVAIPAITEVDDAVQLLGDLQQKYALLLTDTDVRIEPVMGFDWAAALREPWLSGQGAAKRPTDPSPYRA